MPAEVTEWTAEMVRAVPDDGKRYEVLDGEQPLASWRDVSGLVLAIEAVSPSTAHADRHRKRRIYMEEAVDEYWIVDVDARGSSDGARATTGPRFWKGVAPLSTRRTQSTANRTT